MRPTGHPSKATHSPAAQVMRLGAGRLGLEGILGACAQNVYTRSTQGHTQRLTQGSRASREALRKDPSQRMSEVRPDLHQYAGQGSLRRQSMHEGRGHTAALMVISVCVCVRTYSLPAGFQAAAWDHTWLG